jgi:hypothetical protein
LSPIGEGRANPIDLKAKRPRGSGAKVRDLGNTWPAEGASCAPGDTTLVFDPLNSRYLAVLPDGKPGATFRLEYGAPLAIGSARGRSARTRIWRGLPPRARTEEFYAKVPGFMGPWTGDIGFRPDHPGDRKTFGTTRLPLPSGEEQCVSSRAIQGESAPHHASGHRRHLPACHGGLKAALSRGSCKDYHVESSGPTSSDLRRAAVLPTPVKVGEGKDRARTHAPPSPVAIMRNNEMARHPNVGTPGRGALRAGHPPFADRGRGSER